MKLGTARPQAVSGALLRCGGAPAPLDVLLERSAEERRDDAGAAYFRRVAKSIVLVLFGDQQTVVRGTSRQYAGFGEQHARTPSVVRQLRRATLTRVTLGERGHSARYGRHIAGQRLSLH